MNKYNIRELGRRYWADKKAGIKREPLHTLQECYEEAGITYQKYAKLREKYPGAPEPRLVTRPSMTGRPVQHYNKKDVLAYIEQCRKAEGA